MKFCQKCGKELLDQAVICPGCGCSCAPQQTTAVPTYASNTVVNQVTDMESSSLANCALLFSFLMPIIGLILGIVGAVKYRTPSYKSRCITAIIVGPLVWFGVFLIFMNI